MSLRATLKADPGVPLEAEVLAPERLAGLSEREAARLPVVHGNAMAELGQFFDLARAGGDEDELVVAGDLAPVKLIGAGMTRGRIVVEGDVGLHLGSAMAGGEIVVEGNAGDWAGAEMSGGRIVIKGGAGHGLGSAYRGSRVGMRGGEIVVFGQAGNEIGNTVRNGLIAVGGAAGDFVGVNMLAGTIVVFGEMGIRAGAGMKRGSIVAMGAAELLPTFRYACRYRPPFLPLYLTHLRRLGLPVEERFVAGDYKRWSGDSVELNRGEVLLFDAEAA